MWVCAILLLWATGLAQGSPNGGVRQGDCANVHRRCIYREGCGKAFSNYMLWCSDVVHGAPGCSEPCQHALIALVSTEEGNELMNCDCDEEYCMNTKQRMEICRPHVLRGAQNETMSCRLSQLICVADSTCAAALKFYQRNCRAVFDGRKCSRKCHNSIMILRKQEKANKLSNCKCDGFENYDCPRVKSNMDRLCFKIKSKLEDYETTTLSDDIRSNTINSADRTRQTINSIVIFSIVKYLTT